MPTLTQIKPKLTFNKDIAGFFIGIQTTIKPIQAI
jgi:hypothetical protein